MQYRLVFSGPIKANPGNALRARVAAVIEQADFEGLTIVFSSEGGDTREGLSLYNFFRSLPRPVTMHAAGHVDSMGVSVFLSGATRTCSPVSRFFFHPFSWTFDTNQKIEGIEDARARFLNDVVNARRILRDRTNLPEETTNSLYGRSSRSVVADPKKALEWGIVSSIGELNPEGRTQENVKVVTVTW